MAFVIAVLPPCRSVRSEARGGSAKAIRLISLLRVILCVLPSLVKIVGCGGAARWFTFGLGVQQVEVSIIFVRTAQPLVAGCHCVKPCDDQISKGPRLPRLLDRALDRFPDFWIGRHVLLSGANLGQLRQPVATLFVRRAGVAVTGPAHKVYDARNLVGHSGICAEAAPDALDRLQAGPV